MDPDRDQHDEVAPVDVDDTSELFAIGHLPPEETGDRSRATRATRLAQTYLDRRRSRLRDQLGRDEAC